MIPDNVQETPDAVPREEPRSRYGNPNSYEVFGETFEVLPSAHGYHQHGVASWYGTQFHGLRTASGEQYDMFAMTAAHKTLPIPTYLKVTNLNNHLSVVVRVNDRGPFLGERLLDLSYAAAAKLDMLGNRLRTGGGSRRSSRCVPEPADTASGLYLQVGSFADPVDAVLRRQAIVDLGIQRVRIEQRAQWPPLPPSRLRGPLPQRCRSQAHPFAARQRQHRQCLGTAVADSLRYHAPRTFFFHHLRIPA